MPSMTRSNRQKERLIDAVNRLPTLNSSVALQVHGAMTGVIWLGRLEEEY